MKTVKSMNDEQVIGKGINALHRVLGPAGTRRFMNMTRIRNEDSVMRHRKWQEKLDKDEFFDKVFGPNSK